MFFDFSFLSYKGSASHQQTDTLIEQSEQLKLLPQHLHVQKLYRCLKNSIVLCFKAIEITSKAFLKA